MLGSLTLALLFLAFTWTTKEIAVLYVHTPWQNDPYDAVVSFAIFFVPLLVGLCLLRVPLCRREETLPVRRAIDLLRACRVLVGAMVITLTSDWASVTLGADSSTWTSTTSVFLGLLAVLTALAGVVCWQLWLPGGEMLKQGNACAPDWLDDVVALGEREASRLGSRRSQQAVRLLRWFDVQLLTRVRSHPLRAAAVLSLVFGAAIASSQTLEEGVGPIALIFFSVGACGMFAFLAIAGAYLRVVGTRGEASRSVSALVLGSASAPVALAFRGALWPLFGLSDKNAGLAQLALLLLVVATVTGGVTFAFAPLVRGRRLGVR